MTTASDDADRHDPPRVARMVEAERLKRARDPVPHVQADEQRGDHVEADPQRVAEDLDLGAVQIP